MDCHTAESIVFNHDDINRYHSLNPRVSILYLFADEISYILTKIIEQDFRVTIGITAIYFLIFFTERHLYRLRSNINDLLVSLILDNRITTYCQRLHIFSYAIVIAVFPYLSFLKQRAIINLSCLFDDRVFLALIVHNNVIPTRVKTWDGDIEICSMECHTIHCWLYFLYFKFYLVNPWIFSWFLVKIGIVVRSALG